MDRSPIYLSVMGELDRDDSLEYAVNKTIKKFLKLRDFIYNLNAEDDLRNRFPDIWKTLFPDRD